MIENKFIDDIIRFFDLEKNRNMICDHVMVIEALKELNSLIELDDIKLDIVSNLKYILLERVRNSKVDQNHAIHTVIYGSPGMGKSTLAKILAKIYIGIKINKETNVNKNENTDVNYINSNTNNNIKNLTDTNSKSNTNHKLGLNCDYHKSLCGYDNSISVQDSLINALEKSNDIRKIIESMNLPDCKLNYKVNFGLKDIVFSIENSLHNLEIKNQEFTTVSNSKKTESKTNSKDPNIIFARREDLVDNIIGGTAIKTNKVLEKAKGGVLIIDEAYSLCYSDSNNDFGQEALTCIIDFMDKNPRDIVVIFCGYKEKLKNTIFKVQPGLERRCQWFFEIENYTVKGLYKIFKQKIKKDGWYIHPNAKSIIMKSLSLNKKTLFKFNGGSIEKLVTQCKITYSDKNFFNTNIDSIIDKEIFLKAIEKLQVHQLKDDI